MQIAAQDVVTAALGKLRVYGVGDTISSYDMDLGLQTLNDMLDSFSVDGLLIYGLTEELFPLTAGQYLYTMGVGGNFNTSIPGRIDNSTFLRENLTNIDTPLNPLTKEEYSGISLKDEPSGIPTDYYADPQLPYWNFILWPPPMAGYTVHIVSEKPFSSFADLVTQYQFAPGYKQVMVYNLAIHMAPDFKKQVTQEVINFAVTLKSKLKSKNARPIRGIIDIPAGMKTGRGNIFNRWEA